MAIQVPLNQIVDNPFQSRTVFDRDAIHSLANEMKEGGIWSGILQGRRNKHGQIELVFGHRRVRAMRLLNIPTVSIELVDLTDAQMALRNLEENLQREGLTDLEKADSVKRAVEVARAELKAAGKNTSHAIEQVSTRLGLSIRWITQLCEISGSMDPENREDISAGFITAKTALAAKEFGGDTYLKTLAAQGKQSIETKGQTPKPTHMTVGAMAKIVREAPEHVQAKLKTAIITGEVTTPAQAEAKRNRLAAEQTKRSKSSPPDLKAVVSDWTFRLNTWTEQMKDIAPYMEYVEEVPDIAGNFRSALKKFVAAANKLID